MLVLEPAKLENLVPHLHPREVRVPTALLRRAALLNPKDRLILELAIEKGLSRRQIGVLVGLSPGNVSRRLWRLANRLREPIVIALAERDCPLPPDYRQIGIGYFVQRRTISDLAREHGISPAEVRVMLEFIRGWHKGLTARR